VTASLGVASNESAQGATGCEELLAQADRQLYRAKHQGRDQVASQT
jgi:PleD family two-component response regulator